MRGGTAARSFSGSKTLTRSVPPGTWSPASSTDCDGWVSTGTKDPTPAARTPPTSNHSGSRCIARWRRASVAEGRAYYCYCSADTIQAKRQAAEAAGGGWVYDRTCCALTTEQIAALESAGTPRAVRFKVPPGKTTFDDLVHGPIEFDNAVIEDFVVLRSDAQPTYHLSVVADDIDMEITHVVRGDDHISNTPKQVLLYQAFGRTPPSFAHVPLILGPDKKRLSKRHGATSVMEYPRLGYLPEAMVNFLALLGWSPGGDQELFTRDELVQQFTLEGISGGNAVFNPDKLDWFNQQHMMRMDTSELARRVEPVLRAQGMWKDEYEGARRQWFFTILDLYKSRVKRLDDFGKDAKPILTDEVEYDPGAVKKHLASPEINTLLDELASAYERTDPFQADVLEPLLRQLADAKGLKAGALIHATRVAVMGRATSPGLFEVLELVGKQRAVNRMRTVSLRTTSA